MHPEGTLRAHSGLKFESTSKGWAGEGDVQVCI